jgi:hypothetical protein
MINRAIKQIRGSRGSSFLTHGSDDFDHRGLNRARRAMDTAAILEQLEEMDQEEAKAADYRWKVMVWLIDGDKPWLDSWVVVGLYQTQQEAEARVEASRPYADEHRQPYCELVDVDTDPDAHYFLELQEWRQSWEPRR